MAKLLKPPEEAKKAITARIQAGKDLTAKAEIAKRTGGYEDWLAIFAKWREETAAELTTIYEGGDIGRDFTAVTTTGEYSSPRYTFPYRKSALEAGISWLELLIDRLELAIWEGFVSPVAATTQRAQVAVEPSHDEFLSATGSEARRVKAGQRDMETAGMAKDITREVLIKVANLKGMLGSRATGGTPDEQAYAKLRAELLAMPPIRDALPTFVLSCSTIREFWNFIKDMFQVPAEDGIPTAGVLTDSFEA